MLSAAAYSHYHCTSGLHRLALPLSSLFDFKPLHSIGLTSNKDKALGCGFRLTRNVISKANEKELFQSNMPLTVENETGREVPVLDEVTLIDKEEIGEGIESIKKILESLEDGEITFSAYDTAWVAMVKDVHGRDKPQFPTSLDWIADNQLVDGSWGFDSIFSAYDRLISTIACVVALKSWNVHPQKCEKGISFFIQNLNKLEKEKSQHMSCGFEMIFPSLLDLARGLGIQFPIDSPILQAIYAKRERKLKRIPKDMMHKVATSLLYSLEGTQGIELNWEQILKLKCKDGSFLNSPASTAYALMHTNDSHCLQYLSNLVLKFNGAAPTTYPFETFERLWVVDRLQRLGISRHFQLHISNHCINYFKRNWKSQGIGATRNSNVPDIDDTCMAFRLLRLHGHHVSADVFNEFKQGNEFFCYPGQTDGGVTDMFNLYRASQVMFPGEKILNDAKEFTHKFLREKQVLNELSDKWVLGKDLAGEVGYGLDVPWYASLPRVETRYYLEQYGGEDDIWIAKVLYRLPYVNNNTYLEVAKQDYNYCQALHQCEWKSINKWHREFKLRDFGVSQETLLRAYFMATANIFEPERSNERVSWAKTAILVEALSSYSHHQPTSTKAFVYDFLNHVNKHDVISARPNVGMVWDRTEVGKELVRILFKESVSQTLNQDRLLDAWEEWLRKWEKDVAGDGEAELIVATIMVTSHSQQILSDARYHSLMALTNSVCSKLRPYHKQQQQEVDCATTTEIEAEMQQLVELVLDSSLDPQATNIFMSVAKSFYYMAYFPTSIMQLHAAKVLFQALD